MRQVAALLFVFAFNGILINESSADPVQCNITADIVIILDGSGSVGAGNFALALDFLSTFLDSLLVGDVFYGLIQYGNTASVNRAFQDLTAGNADVTSVVYGGGGTNTPAGLIAALNMISSSIRNVPRRCILLSDGQTNVDQGGLSSAASNLRGVCKVFSIGIGGGVSMGSTGFNELVNISSTGTVLSIANFGQLSSNDTVEELCDGITVIEDKPCVQGSDDVSTTCGFFRCTQNGTGDFLYKEYFTACPFPQGPTDCLDFNANATVGNCVKYGCSGITCTGSICEGTSVDVVDTGCLVNGVCIFMEDNMYDTGPPECNQKICGIDGTPVVVRDDCNVGGTCVANGTTVNSGCNETICLDGSIENFRNGCDINGTCLYPDDPALDLGNCVFRFCKQICNGNVQLKTIKRCVDGSVCRDIGYTSTDSPCVIHKCVLKYGSAQLVTIVKGCEHPPSICRSPGYKVISTACISFQCISNGSFVIHKTGCQFQGKCLPPGTALPLPHTLYHTPSCGTYTCTVDTSDHKTATEHLTTSQGCYIDGQCLQHGETKTKGCITYTCGNYGSHSIDKKCDIHGQCVAIGHTITKNCTIKTCRSDLRVHTDHGCYIDGQCLQHGETKTTGCITYTCGYYGRHSIDKKCDIHGQCVAIGHTITKDCNKKTCRSDLGVHTEYGCLWYKQCYHSGRIWKAGLSGTCFKFTCLHGTNGHIKQEAICQDHHGVCKHIGESGFVCNFHGRKCHKCVCIQHGHIGKLQCNDHIHQHHRRRVRHHG